MSYSVIQQGDTVQYGVYEVVCDSLEDINTLPTEWASGSSAIVVEGEGQTSVFMLGVDKVWRQI